jgi:hypothetical protein
LHLEMLISKLLIKFKQTYLYHKQKSMPKLYFALFFIFVTGLRANAQQGNYSLLNPGVHPGTVILADGQVLKGFVIYKNREANQKECIFYIDYNDPSSQKIY